MEDFLGKRVDSAQYSSPLNVVGFSDIPPVGAPFTTVPDKRTAVKVAADNASHLSKAATQVTTDEDGMFVLPVVLKSDVVGSIDALKHELRKHEDERTVIRVVHEGVGAVAESDVKAAMGSKDTIVVGFNVSVDGAAQELADRQGVEIARFSIIYDLADWLPSAISARRPKVTGEVETGRAKVLKCFSFTHKEQTIGCRVESGALVHKDRVRLMRGDTEIGRGHVMNLKSGKSDSSQIMAGSDCGAQLHMDLDTQPSFGDLLIAFSMQEA
jgi:translation initiation factor IF-2